MDPEADLVALAEALGLPAPPQRIEGFDISNISGTLKVPSVVSFRNGRRIAQTTGGCKSRRSRVRMTSLAWRAVRRRYTRLLKETGIRSPKSEVRKESREEGGEAIPQELQKLVDGRANGCGATERRHPPPPSFPSANLILIDGGKGQLGCRMRGTSQAGVGTVARDRPSEEYEESTGLA